MRYTHGKAHTRIHTIWRNMKYRCENPHHTTFHNYGGRGISVCPEWQNNFQAFYDWAMANGYSDELTLDRIDTNGNYCPQNCRWATKKTQSENRRTKIVIVIDGVPKTILQLANENGLKPATVRRRYDRGWRGADLIKRKGSRNDCTKMQPSASTARNLHPKSGRSVNNRF